VASITPTRNFALPSALVAMFWNVLIRTAISFAYGRFQFAVLSIMNRTFGISASSG
jgi:hypothetical protein